MNELKAGQIYTLNGGETLDVIREHFPDGSGSWCYDICVMRDIYDEHGNILFQGDGKIVDVEDCALDLIREKGVLVGQLGETHEYDEGLKRIKR